MGMPSHSLDGVPDGICNTGTEAVSVGGTGVLLGVVVGSGVLVEIGKLVSVAMGVFVGSGTKVLHEAKLINSAQSRMTFPMIFIDVSFCLDD